MGAGTSRRAEEGALRGQPQRAQERGGGPSLGIKGEPLPGLFSKVDLQSPLLAFPLVN